MATRSILAEVAKGVSWSVLLLVAGLFVIVEALKNAGCCVWTRGTTATYGDLTGVAKERQLLCSVTLEWNE